MSPDGEAKETVDRDLGSAEASAVVERALHGGEDGVAVSAGVDCKDAGEALNALDSHQLDAPSERPASPQPSVPVPSKEDGTVALSRSSSVRSNALVPPPHPPLAGRPAPVEMGDMQWD